MDSVCNAAAYLQTSNANSPLCDTPFISPNHITLTYSVSKQLNNVLTGLGVAAEVTVDEHLSALISLYGKPSFEFNTISGFSLALQKNDKLIY